MATVGDARSFKGKQLSGSLTSGETWVFDGTYMVPGASAGSPAGWATVSGWASGGSGLATATSGLVILISGVLSSGITDTSGIAQSGYDMASGTSGYAVLVSGDLAAVAAVASGGSGKGAYASGAIDDVSGQSGFVMCSGANLMRWSGIPTSGYALLLSGTNILTQMYWGDPVPTLPTVSGIAQSGLNLAKTVKETITQASHGFAAGNAIRRDSGTSTWVKAQADTEEHVEALGIVESVNGNDFTVVYTGRVSGLTGLTDGLAYYVSEATAGLLTATEPDPELYFSKPLLVADSASGGIVVNMRTLSLSYGSGAVMRADVVGGRLEYVDSGQIKWAFHESNQIRLWNPGTSGWEIVQVATEPTLAYNFTDLSGWDASGGKAYDIFAEYSGSTGFVLVANPWSGANARYVEPARWQGAYCYDNTTDDGKSRRWLGTVYLATGPVFAWDTTTRYLWNMYHQQEIRGQTRNSGVSGYWWTGTSFSESNGGSGHNRAQIVLGATTQVRAVGGAYMHSVTGGDAKVCLGIDSTSTRSGIAATEGVAGTGPLAWGSALTPGYHYITLLQRMTAGSGFFWTANGVDQFCDIYYDG